MVKGVVIKDVTCWEIGCVLFHSHDLGDYFALRFGYTSVWIGS